MPITTESVRCRAALAAWGTDAFAPALKRDIEGLAPDALPLAKATGRGGYVDPAGIEVTVLGAHDDGRLLRVCVGLFFEEILGGCSCGDDPAPENRYCELLVSIDKRSAEAALSLVGS